MSRFEGLSPSSSTSLYGLSIASNTSWTYLFGQCHRQFVAVTKVDD